jgi:hypothetical protein
MSNLNRILLVNDTRGAQEYLYRAFRAMGLECDLATFGWATINTVERQLNFDPLRDWGLLGKLPRPFINLLNVSRLKNYDVASYVHRISFLDKPHVLRYSDLSHVRERINVMSYTALGCDEIAYIAGNADLPYTPCSTCQQFDDPQHYCPRVVRPLRPRALESLNRYFDCAFSTAVEYSHLETLFEGPTARLPLPVDTSDIPWAPAGQDQSGKIKIMHAPSRGGFKGTAEVLKAIEQLSKLRDDFEFSIVSGLPFSEYISVIRQADIVIDQVWSQSPGMNALWLMSMGKVIFSGNTELARNFFPFGAKSPIIDADPNPVELAARLSDALSQRSNFARLAEAGRHYVNENHGHMKVASQYLVHWDRLARRSPAAA